MRIAVAADHAGFEMKRDLAAALRAQGRAVLIVEPGSAQPEEEQA